MVNLRNCGGKVPIKNSTQHEATPYLLVNFPSREVFDKMYAKHKDQALKDRYWVILNARSRGATLTNAGKPFGITRERVRQIEARFQRLVGEKYSTQLEANLFKLSELQNLLESFSNSEMHGKNLPSDGNR